MASSRDVNCEYVVTDLAEKADIDYSTTELLGKNSSDGGMKDVLDCEEIVDDKQHMSEEP